MGGNANPAKWHIDNLGIALEIGITGLVGGIVCLERERGYHHAGFSIRLLYCNGRNHGFFLPARRHPTSSRSTVTVTPGYLNYFRDEGIRVKSFRMVMHEEGAVHTHFALSGKATWLCF
ncbi:hypothetical protein DVH26_10365 [Paenibacillus sp. H1-7]|uniref:hypothetical protein n=1 Tax=Paenibacillus sp. H1-7 TaxID=2282849 RepID=UPI001EF7602F|nr:hypothetical protein [Paenibacillus sp. H1-7]ULL14814.1 hypothetical protein DVH26_10365 [Paenibacillus sp. H1-7]